MKETFAVARVITLHSEDQLTHIKVWQIKAVFKEVPAASLSHNSFHYSRFPS